MHPSDVVLRFIDSVGSRREAGFYLSLFRSGAPEAFAMIAVSGAILREASDALAVDLRFLAGLGLTPALVLGAFEPDAPPVTEQRAAELVARLAPGVRCARIAVGADPATAASAARDAARGGAIPVLVAGAPGPAEAGHAPEDTHADLVAALAAALGTRKAVFLGPHSGLEPAGGEIPSLVDVTHEHAALRPRLSPDQAALLDRIHDLLHAVPHRLTVAVTSPFDLLRELFTTRGAGTLLRRGAQVTRHASYTGVDLAAVRRLLESAFARPLAPDFFERPIAALYLADDARGLAIVHHTPHGAYLGKFAVERQAQGEGVGGDLWRALVRDHPALIWRSRADNPINPWYAQRCDGMVRAGPWQVFWRGLPVARVPAAVDLACASPADFPLPAASSARPAV